MDIAKRFLLGDFLVKYRFFTQAEGGRMNPALQGYRSDWVYADDYTEWEISNKKDLLQVYMIWPWAVDENGLEYSQHEFMPHEGFADMRICVDQMRPVHRKKIRVGVKGYFVEGSRRVAEAEVIDILYLNHDLGLDAYIM
jgi:hypothetical protein